jgi:phospholipid/cholesterol/gamma-HCH transport system ATP-binding protein
MEQAASAPTTSPIVRIRDLVAGFGPRNVLDGLSLDVNRGEILGVVGGSGSGKSVLLRTIIGLIPKRAGTIELFGRNVDTLDGNELRVIQRRWGVMFQHGALFSSLTVKQNIQFQMRESLDLSDRLKDEMAIAKLEMVGLRASDGDRMPSELSGGMTKRVALARALALDPEFVLLDEPTSGLDPISAGDFDDLMKTLQSTLGLTVFLVTHDLESLYAVCDRIAVLAEGKVVAQGTIEAMLANRHPWVESYFRGRRGSMLAQQAKIKQAGQKQTGKANRGAARSAATRGPTR